MSSQIVWRLLLAAFFLLSGICPASGAPIRILTAGIMHESDTFNTNLTQEKEFTVRRGEEMLRGEKWAQYLNEQGVEIIPTLHANAPPGGMVARKAYEDFKAEILAGARRAGKVDGVFLKMHGAMQVEGYPDAQVDFVRALREIIGPEPIISGAFDLHGNISPAFVKEMNIMTVYRTAPHVDLDETRLRAVQLLLTALREHLHPEVVLVQVPIIIPGERGITAALPLKPIYDQLPALSQEKGLLDASIFVGMPWTDVPRTGMSVVVTARSAADRPLALSVADKLAEQLWEHRADLKFDVPTASLDDAIKTALAAPEKTVFITDSGDNATAGGTGDTTIVLRKLKAMGVKDAVVAGMVDPAAVAACQSAGVGQRVKLSVGGKLDRVHGGPLDIEGVVRFVSTESHVQATTGRAIGRTAVVDWDGILIALVETRTGFISPQDFQQVNIDPLAHKIVVVKLGYLFQGLRDIAPRAIMALTPGFAEQTLENLPYKNIRRPIYPMDPDMKWSPPET